MNWVDERPAILLYGNPMDAPLQPTTKPQNTISHENPHANIFNCEGPYLCSNKPRRLAYRVSEFTGEAKNIQLKTGGCFKQINLLVSHENTW